jgi:uncharacterized protein
LRGKNLDLSNIQPIPNKPALMIHDKILVVADLHIGIESELQTHGVNLVSQTKNMINNFKKICKKYNPEQIVLLGDIKHNIPMSTISERKDVQNFLEEIIKIAKVHIVVGNHDGFINKLTPSAIDIHPSDGFTIENIGFAHGHSWPKKEVILCDQIITAHTHPTIMLTDRLKHKSFEPCWINAKIDEEKIKEKYKTEKNPKILIMPAFNPLCGGIAINKDGITGPLNKIIKIPISSVYLLDGTSLGLVKNIK